MRDADSDIGARLEVFAAGAYVWLPFEHLASLEMAPPQRLRDTLWAPALVQTGPSFKGMDLGEVLIPAIYPFSWKHPDEQVWLGRLTEWLGNEGGGESPWVRKCSSSTARSFRFSKSGRLSFHTRKIRLHNNENDSHLRDRSTCRFAKIFLLPSPVKIPSGVDLRYDTKLLIFDKIKEARRQDDELAQGEWQNERKTANWPVALKLAQESLATKSKDLQLAAYLTEALLQTERFAGLRQGLDLTYRLLTESWDTVYPLIEDGDLELARGPAGMDRLHAGSSHSFHSHRFRGLLLYRLQGFPDGRL